MDGPQSGVGRLRVLRRVGYATAPRLRNGALPWWALYAGKHRSSLSLVQHQQMERRGHKLVETKAARRECVPAAPLSDQQRARTAVLSRAVDVTAPGLVSGESV